MVDVSDRTSPTLESLPLSPITVPSVTGEGTHCAIFHNMLLVSRNLYVEIYDLADPANPAWSDYSETSWTGLFRKAWMIGGHAKTVYTVNEILTGTAGMRIYPLQGGFIFSAASQSGSISISTDSECAWEATTETAWITLTGETTGSGDGTVTFDLALNTSGNDRVGVITVQGEDVEIYQEG